MNKLLAGLILLLSAVNADAASRFAICNTACTWDNASTAMWSATTGGATGASAPTVGDTANLDGNTCVGGTTCTITVNANLTVDTINMGNCSASTTGCVLDFSVNNNTVTISGNFGNSGTGTRVLKLGASVWTITANGGNVWDQAGVTNLTMLAGTSTLNFTGSSGSRQFIGGSQTYHTVSFGAVSAQGSILILGDNTFDNLNFAAPNFVEFATPSVTTITNTLTTSMWGGSISSQLSINSNVPGVTATIALSGSSSVAWTAFRDMVITGGLIAASSFNLGNNTGVTFLPLTGGSCILGG